jgi:hypothetical protein
MKKSFALSFVSVLTLCGFAHAQFVGPRRNWMRKLPWLLALAMLVFSSVSYAQVYARPTGILKYHLFTIPGVINDGMGTVFTCTNALSMSVTIGVEVFATGGGPAVNDAMATATVLAPGATVMYSTRPMTGFVADRNLGAPLIYKGSARILSTARSGVLCSAFVADPLNSPPTSMANLTIVRKTVQKGQ